MKENKTLITKATKQSNHQYNKQIHKNKNKNANPFDRSTEIR